MSGIDSRSQKARTVERKRLDREASRACLERANGYCELRLEGCLGNATEPHHIRPKSTHPHIRHDQSNLIAVCRLCHGWAERNKRAGIELCEEIKTK
jgi:hypothetical protein